MSTNLGEPGMFPEEQEGGFAGQRAPVESGRGNSLSVAAGPLLRALADMPEEIAADEDVIVLRQLLLDGVQAFERDCERMRVRRDHALIGGYALCTAVDEAASRSVWGRRNDWAGHSLLVHCYQDAYGGEKVFQLLGRLATSPVEHAPLLDLLYRVLSLGFRGRYAGRTDGERELDGIRARLWRVMDSVADDVAGRTNVAAMPLVFSGGSGSKPVWWSALPPAWTSAALAGVALIVLHGVHRTQLEQEITAINTHIALLGVHLPATAPVLATEPLIHRLRTLLGNDIERGRLTIAEAGDQVKLTLPGQDTFDAGQADVRVGVPPLLARIAEAITRLGSHVAVIAHTDDAPIRTTRFPSNQALSDARAATIVSLLVARGVSRDVIHGVGKGDQEPVTGLPAGTDRARHRRVEIAVWFAPGENQR